MYAALCLTVAACGGAEVSEDLAAGEIVERTQQKAWLARSFRLRLESEAEKTSADLMMDMSGNCSGKITNSDGSFEVVKLIDQVWVRPDDAFWEKQPDSSGGEVSGSAASNTAAAAALRGKYVHGPASHAFFKSVLVLCDKRQLTGSVFAEPAGRNLTSTKKGTAVVDGQPVLVVSVEPEEGDASTVYVAAEGKPYPLKVEKGGEKAETRLLSDFELTVPKKTPPEGETVPVSRLEELQKGAL
ncbi:hypothetical protein [Streptomyces sp. GC420]|uniref:hypothetical protein n=1 Tax=Streptomyces sp. GC420 TaxID=2697568 RepID=UPI0014151D2C|nr:hypothetical protein [Streptomyces sp. GC420]NBM17887.1 hypothetical protein [Streptomyces sp. GC420]